MKGFIDEFTYVSKYINVTSTNSNASLLRMLHSKNCIGAQNVTRRITKKGNQDTINAPTTIARVFPALNSRRKWTVVRELRLAVAATALA